MSTHYYAKETLLPAIINYCRQVNFPINRNNLTSMTYEILKHIQESSNLTIRTDQLEPLNWLEYKKLERLAQSTDPRMKIPVSDFAVIRYEINRYFQQHSN